MSSILQRLAGVLFAAVILPAQTPPVVSPEVHPDRTVTFRVGRSR